MQMDATGSVDQIIANYDSISLTVYLSLAVIIVALLALGREFWVALWGVIFSPSMTFQRLLGEAQTVPGLVVVGLIGITNGTIILSYISDPPLTQWWVNIDFANVPVLGMLLTQMDSILGQAGWDRSVLEIIKYMQENPFQAQSVAVAVPLIWVLIWLLWGVAGQLASMIAGNKAGHGVSNLWSALPFQFVLTVLPTWFFLISLHGNGTARLLFWLFSIYYFVEHVILMREHGRYNLQKAVMASILTFVLLVALIFILTIAVLVLIQQLSNYIG